MHSLLTFLLCSLQVEVRKQRTAFPPNFVHSLDGTHMMMTAVTCRDAGLRFAGLWFSPMHLTRKNHPLHTI